MWAASLAGVFMCLVCSVMRRLGAEAESIGGYEVKTQARCFYNANRFFSLSCKVATKIYIVSATYSIENCKRGPDKYTGRSCSRPVHEVNPVQYQHMITQCTARRLCYNRIQATQADLRNHCNTTFYTDTVTIKWICVPKSAAFDMCPSMTESKIGKRGILQNTRYPQYSSLPPSMDCQCKLSVMKQTTISIWIVELQLNSQKTACSSELALTAPQQPSARFDCRYRAQTLVVRRNLVKSAQVKMLLTSDGISQNGRYTLLYQGTMAVNVTCGLYPFQVRSTTQAQSSSRLSSIPTGHGLNTSVTPSINKPEPTVTPASISKEAVAGGVSGAVVVLLVLTAVIVFLYIRRHPEKSCLQTKAVAEGGTSPTPGRADDEGNRLSHLQISEPVLTSATNQQVVADKGCKNIAENVYAQPGQAIDSSLENVYQDPCNPLDKGGGYTSLSTGGAAGTIYDTHYTVLDHRDNNYTSLNAGNAGLLDSSEYTPLEGAVEEGGVDNNIYYSIEARGMEHSKEEPPYYELETQPDNEAIA